MSGALAWVALGVAFGALLTANGVRALVLLAYCAALALFVWAWSRQGYRQWWQERSSPGPNLLLLFALLAAGAFAGRLLAGALGA